jgi:lipopolysaccharide transport system permease protein
MTSNIADERLAQNRTMGTQSQSAVPDTEIPTLHIAPHHGWLSLQFGELWRYRELLYFLVWRDIQIKYKQTVIGAAWAIIQPVMTMVIFTFIFGGLAKIPSDGIPYPIFSFAALVPWGLFSAALGRTSSSVVGAGGLIKKVYFPRLVIPLSSVLSGLVDFGISLVILLILMLVYQITPTWNIVLLPFFILLALITALGAGLWLSALNTQFRDIGYIVPFLIQVWMYVTPVIYPTSLIHNDLLRVLSALNPLSGVIDGFRWALLGADATFGPLTLISIVMALLLLVSGALYFRRMEDSFADII